MLDAEWVFAPLHPTEQLFVNFQTLFYGCVLCTHVKSLQGELLHSSCGRIYPNLPSPTCLKAINSKFSEDEVASPRREDISDPSTENLRSVWMLAKN